jgi:hypothetical protein
MKNPTPHDWMSSFETKEGADNSGFIFALPAAEYAAAHIGLEGRYRFGRGIELVGALLYLPGFNNPSEDWLFRTVIDLVVPVFDPLALKLRISNVNDNNPSPNVGTNKFTTTISLSVRFQPTQADEGSHLKY